jgi:uncharacterized protein YaiI (UPF0178 family)
VKFLVDADSCPRPARELVLRTALRRHIDAVFAANRSIPGIEGQGSPGCSITMLVCPATPGAADDALVTRAAPGDIAVTRDLPLADRLLQKGAAVLDDRGRLFTADNIRELVSVRDFTVSLARDGLAVQGSPA